MKIAVISDIHSNFTYLQSILSDVKSGSVEKILFLGDAVGYYDKPDEVINWLRENNVLCLKGNHEKYLLGEVDYPESKEKFYRIQKQRNQISKENIDWISTWGDGQSLNLGGQKIYISHSGFDDCERYCRSHSELNKEFLAEFDYFLFGHTHIPWVEYYYGTCILNPGSIGQPRDYTRMVSFAIIDLESATINLVKKKVDFLSYTEFLRRESYEKQVIEILERVR